MVDHRRPTSNVKPIDRFPDKPRRDGRFQKRIRGRLYYFGSNGDRPAALLEYNRVKADLYAGRKPRLNSGNEDRLDYLAERYIEHLGHEVKAGRTSPKWFGQCGEAIERFVTFAGPDRDPADLRPDDFAGYARHLVGKLEFGDYTFNRERASIVTWFNFAAENDWLDVAPKFGKGFRKISTSRLRKQRRRRLLDRATVRLLLRHAGPQLRAMILLGLNGGYGPTDCAQLQAGLIDRKRMMIVNYKRPKTNIDRDTPLWPETLAAIDKAMAKRPADNLVFRTRQGKQWANTAIGHEFRKLLARGNARITRERKQSRAISATAYDLRHTFFTLAVQAGANVFAVKRISGHAQGGMSDVYLHGIPDAMLRAVTDCVRTAIFLPCSKARAGDP